MIFGLYLLAAAFGVPLVLWFSLVGDSDGGFDIGGDVGDIGDIGDVGDADLGGDGARFPLPLGAMAFGSAGFGLTGLALHYLAGGGVFGLIAALVVGALAGGFYHVLLKGVRKGESDSSISNRELTGRIGQVALPIRAGGRGQVMIEAGGQTLYLSATAHDPAEVSLLGKGASVIVVEVDGGVARVTPVSAELESGD